jgi:hypothetical protein
MKLSEATFHRSLCNYAPSERRIAAVFRPSLALEPATVAEFKMSRPAAEPAVSKRLAALLLRKKYRHREADGIYPVCGDIFTELTGEGPRIFEREGGAVKAHCCENGFPITGIEKAWRILDFYKAHQRMEKPYEIIRVDLLRHGKARTVKISKSEDVFLGNDNIYVLAHSSMLIAYKNLQNLDWFDSEEAARMKGYTYSI